MFSQFLPLALSRGSEHRCRSRDGRRRPPGRHRRSFHGRLEPLEGRTLLSFGTGGIVATQGGQAFALAIQPADQGIVAGGDMPTGGGSSAFLLVRYNTDGTLDSKFGSSGIVSTAFNKSDADQINSILVQPSDGKIVAGGTDAYLNTKTYSYQARFALARYNTNGSLDTTFGSGGKVTTSFPSADGRAGINTLLPRSNGEILAVGAVEASIPNNFASVALALYKSNGALDTSFGSSGTMVDNSLSTSSSTPNSSGGTTTVYTYFSASGGALESDNSILVAGTYVTETKVTTSSGSYRWTTNEQDLALVHYLANGTRDLSFGTNGIAITPITPTGVTTSDATGSNVLVQPNGAIVEVGTATGPNGSSDFVVARYNANGTLDTSFASGVGTALVAVGAFPRGDSVALQPNGQIVAAGLVATTLNQYGKPATTGFATVRLNADGSLDTTFGTSGAVITQVLYNDFYSVAVGLETIDSQTMIVDAGTAQISSTNSTQDFALVRYTPSGSLDSGTASAAMTAASPTLTGPTGIISVGSLADESPSSRSIGPAEPAPATSTVPGPGLVLQALESPDFLDTLLPGRRRR